MKKHLIAGVLGLALIVSSVPFHSALADTWTWTKQTGSGSRTWSDIVSSSSGTKLFASGSGYLFTSSDSGVTWTQRTTTVKSWSALASSSDGVRLVATEADPESTTHVAGRIWTSSDSGATWTPHVVTYAGETAPVGSHLLGYRYWSAVASSSDGMKIIATDSGVGDGTTPTNTGYIYTSTDGGTTWTARIAAGKLQWYGAASSADGTKIAGVALVTGAYKTITSTDSGATWAAHAGGGAAIAASADGTKLVAAGGLSIYRSTNGGSTWSSLFTLPAGSMPFRSISSSSDSTKIVTGGSGSSGHLYVSTDSGATWAVQSSAGGSGVTGDWRAVAISGDGSKIAAGMGSPSSSYIWTSVPNIPVCSIGSFTATPTSVPSGASSTLAWTTTNCTSIAITGGLFTGSAQPASSTGTTTGGISAATTYTLTASNGGTPVTSSATVSVTAPATCSIGSFTATPASVASGSASSLAWTTANCTSVSISGGSFSGYQPLNSPTGGRTTGSLSGTTTYTLTAVGSNTVTSTRTVSVTGGTATPCTIDSFTRTPATLASGESATLSWSTTGCSSVSITGGSFSGPQPLSATGVSTGPLTYTTTFVLHAR